MSRVTASMGLTPLVAISAPISAPTELPSRNCVSDLPFKIGEVLESLKCHLLPVPGCFFVAVVVFVAAVSVVGCCCFLFSFLFLRNKFRVSRETVKNLIFLVYEKMNTKTEKPN